MGTRRGRSVSAFILAAAVVTSVVGVVGPPPAVGAEGRTETVPKSIATDCSTDVTSRLTRWIASAPNGSTLSFPSKACYRVDGTLSISGRKGLTFEGNGATIEALTDGTRDRIHVSFSNDKNMTVRDLTIRGANPHAGATAQAYVPARAFQHGFAFHGVDGALLDHVQVHDVYGDFVYVGAAGATWSHDIRVADSKFDGSGRQGISVTAAEGVTIADNVIRNVGRSMFDLEPNTANGGAEKVVIKGNVTGAAKNFWIASKGVGSHIDFTVEHNTMEAKTGNVIWVYGPADGYRGPMVIEDNTFIVGGTVNDEASTGAFFFAKVDGVKMQGNHVSFPAGDHVPFVEVRDSKHLDITGNALTNAGTPLLDTSPAWPRPNQQKAAAPAPAGS